jgi:hypothetical protein
MGILLSVWMRARFGRSSLGVLWQLSARARRIAGQGASDLIGWRQPFAKQ